MERRVPPHDMAAERALLGAAMLSRECLLETSDLVLPEDFYRDAHSVIWEALQKIARRNEVPDTVTVRAALGDKLDRIGGDEFLLQLTDTIPTVEAAAQHACRVSKLAAVRALVHRAGEVMASGYRPIEDPDDWLDGSEALLLQAASKASGPGARKFSAVVNETFQELVAQAERGTELTGISTGLHKLDRHTTGLSSGQMVICAGRPGMGKSAFAGGIATHAARSHGVLVFSLEMTGSQWGRRYLSSEAAVEGRKIRSAKNISPDDWQRITQAAGRADDLHMWFWDRSGSTIADIRREARRVARSARSDGADLKLIIVDYMQLIQSAERGRTREEEVSENSRELKRLAKELDCAVLALAQLNRGVESRADKRPMLSDLRESGAIEQDADTVLFIYRDEVYNQQSKDAGVAEIIIGKQREGQTGIVRCAWRQNFTQFADLVEHEEDERRFADA